MEKEDYCKEITDKSNSDSRNIKNTGKIRGKDQLYGRHVNLSLREVDPDRVSSIQAPTI